MIAPTSKNNTKHDAILMATNNADENEYNHSSIAQQEVSSTTAKPVECMQNQMK